MSSSEPNPPPGLDWQASTPDDSTRPPLGALRDPGRLDLAIAKRALGDRAFDFHPDALQRAIEETLASDD